MGGLADADVSEDDGGPGRDGGALFKSEDLSVEGRCGKRCRRRPLFPSELQVEKHWKRTRAFVAGFVCVSPRRIQTRATVCLGPGSAPRADPALHLPLLLATASFRASLAGSQAQDRQPRQGKAPGLKLLSARRALAAPGAELLGRRRWYHPDPVLRYLALRCGRPTSKVFGLRNGSCLPEVSGVTQAIEDVCPWLRKAI
jgi:hypothetical protein